MVYVNDKPLLLVCDNTVYVKLLPCLDCLTNNAEKSIPYIGAKEHYILDIDDKDGTYVEIPFNIKTEFEKGHIKVHANFEGEYYDVSIVNMGTKNLDGSICYIIGIRKDIRAKIGKQVSDTIKVTIKERQ